MGLVDFLQIDNDAAFTGLGRKARVFGRFVRLCLYFGVEIVFIPPGEPVRNALVERVNGLWASGFFNKDRFASARDLKKKRRKFLAWYEGYCPPSLEGLSVAQATAMVKRRGLSQADVESVPASLPLTQGRVHFVRRVDPTGSIEILKERWRVSKSLQGQYVLATIDLRAGAPFLRSQL